MCVLAVLSACTVESFKVAPCKLGETIGFRISPIDGWFRDYVPRPSRILVRSDDERPYEEARVWETHLAYHGPGDKAYEARPGQRLISYGQKFVGWELEQQPKALINGSKYVLHISDGGHDGWAEFDMGTAIPVC